MSDRWAVVEIMGHRKHIGRISEVGEFGQTFMKVEAFRRDGDFDVFRYGGGSIFAFHEVTEEQARRTFVPHGWRSCNEYADSKVLPGACETCGRTKEEHEQDLARMALPAPRETAIDPLEEINDREDDKHDGNMVPFRHLELMSVQVSNLLALIDTWVESGEVDLDEDAVVVEAARELEAAHQNGTMDATIARWDAEDASEEAAHEANPVADVGADL
jgi:hypothetical protein